MTEALHPGPIDNSDLLVTGTTILKPGLIENKDFVLLPAPVSNYFLDIYKGGPIIFRSVINTGTIEIPNFSIEVYPLEFKVWLCRKMGPLPVPFQSSSPVSSTTSTDIGCTPTPAPTLPSNSQTIIPPLPPSSQTPAWSVSSGRTLPNSVTNSGPIIGVTSPIDWVASKTCTLANVCNDVKDRRLKLSVNTSIRCWVKVVSDTAEQTEDSKTAIVEPAVRDMPSVSEPARATDMETDTDVPPESTAIETQLGTVGRLLTADVVEMNGSWRLIRDPKRVKVTDVVALNHSAGPIEIILEITDVYLAREDDWPRAVQVQAWKSMLKPGDVVDAQDLRGTWFESVIRSVNIADGSLLVHFKGWEDRFDETFPVNKINSKIEPLYSKTLNWRSRLEEDSLVDVKITGEAASLALPGLVPSTIPPVWMPGIVDEIDVAGGRLRVKYSKAELVTVVAAIVTKMQSENPKPTSTSTSSSQELSTDEASSQPVITGDDTDVAAAAVSADGLTDTMNSTDSHTSSVAVAVIEAVSVAVALDDVAMEVEVVPDDVELSNSTKRQRQSTAGDVNTATSVDVIDDAAPM